MRIEDLKNPSIEDHRTKDPRFEPKCEDHVAKNEEFGEKNVHCFMAS